MRMIELQYGVSIDSTIYLMISPTTITLFEPVETTDHETKYRMLSQEHEYWNEAKIEEVDVMIYRNDILLQWNHLDIYKLKLCYEDHSLMMTRCIISDGCEPEYWGTYFDGNGCLIECPKCEGNARLKIIINDGPDYVHCETCNISSHPKLNNKGRYDYKVFTIKNGEGLTTNTPCSVELGVRQQESSHDKT